MGKVVMLHHAREVLNTAKNAMSSIYHVDLFPDTLRYRDTHRASVMLSESGTQSTHTATTFETVEISFDSWKKATGCSSLKMLSKKHPTSFQQHRMKKKIYFVSPTKEELASHGATGKRSYFYKPLFPTPGALQGYQCPWDNKSAISAFGLAFEIVGSKRSWQHACLP